MSNYDNAFISNLIAEEVGEGRQLRLQVVGDSMVPIIKRGDIACIERKSAQELRQGDVIVLHLREGFLMHRLIINDGKQLLLKGDNCVLADPLFDLNSVIGEVVTVKRNGIMTYSKSRNWIMVNSIIGWSSYQNLKLVSFCEYLELKVLKKKSTSITSIIRRMLMFPFKVLIRILI
jgi:signal peptidase I